MSLNLLSRLGYRVVGSRAECKHCTGTARLTVRIFPDGGAYCHRCKWRASPRQLRKQLGMPDALTPEERAAIAERQREDRFKQWCWERYKVAADEYRRLGRVAAIAKQVLQHDPDSEVCWEWLARFYHAEARLSRTLDGYSFMKASPWVNRVTARNLLFAKWQGEQNGRGTAA